MLVHSVVLLFILVLIQGAAAARAQGFMVMVGSRDDLPPPKRFQARTKRLVDNHREGLILFAPLILAAAVLNISNSWTVLGAQIFFYSRLAHSIIYLAGWPVVRFVAWLVGLTGTLFILLALLGLLK
jgi:uncharacterized MAPEG superfamily protein